MMDQWRLIDDARRGLARLMAENGSYEWREALSGYHIRLNGPRGQQREAVVPRGVIELIEDQLSTGTPVSKGLLTLDVVKPHRSSAKHRDRRRSRHT